MPRPVERSTYLPGLDGLRTIAVISVVLFHLAVPHAGGGFLGVAIFFTLSGYLITSLLIKQWDENQTVNLGSFWLHRFRRLLPGVFMIVLTVLALTALLDPTSLGGRWHESLSAVLYYNNWYTIVAGNAYFDQFAGPQPLSHMWSLAIEEQFYLVWPLLFTGLMMLLRKTYKHKAVMGTITACLAVLSALEMAILARSGADNTRVYEGTDTRAFGLLIGAALAFRWPMGIRRSIRSGHGLRLLDAIGTLSALIIAIMLIATNEDSIWLYRGGFILISLATAGILIPLADPSSAANKILGWTPLRWLGERSYGIYLWHMPVIAFMPGAFLKNHLGWAVPTVLFLSIALAALSWTYVEDPIRKNGIVSLFREWWPERSERPSLPPVLTGAASLILVAVLAVGTPLSFSKQNGQPQSDLAHMTQLQKGGTKGVVKEDAGSAPPPAQAAGNEPPKGIDCTSVAYIGDSASIALNSESFLPEPGDRVGAQMRRVGAQNVYIDIKGGRATIERYDGDNAQDAVHRLLAQAVSDTCWAVAMGINDAANMTASGTNDPSNRIGIVMDMIKDQKHILWPTVKTINTDQPPYNNKGMQEYDEALKKMCTKYPNLRVYDWASEVQDNWYTTDGIHPTSQGAREKGHRFADALQKAFPKGDKPIDQCVLDSGDTTPLPTPAAEMPAAPAQ